MMSDKTIYDMDRDELLAEIKRLNTKLERVISEAGRLENRYTDGHELLNEIGVQLEPGNGNMTLAGKIRWLQKEFPAEIRILSDALHAYNRQHQTNITHEEWYKKNQKAWWEIE